MSTLHSNPTSPEDCLPNSVASHQNERGCAHLDMAKANDHSAKSKELGHPAPMVNDKSTKPKEHLDSSMGRLALDESSIMASSGSSVDSDASGDLPVLHSNTIAHLPLRQTSLTTTADPPSSRGSRGGLEAEDWPLSGIREPGINDFLIGRGGAF